jgi:hypothetical protein
MNPVTTANIYNMYGLITSTKKCADGIARERKYINKQQAKAHPIHQMYNQIPVQHTQQEFGNSKNFNVNST